MHAYIFNLFQHGDRLWLSESDVCGRQFLTPKVDPMLESDVCRRQILTSKVDPRAVSVKIFLMFVDP